MRGNGVETVGCPQTHGKDLAQGDGLLTDGSGQQDVDRFTNHHRRGKNRRNTTEV